MTFTSEINWGKFMLKILTISEYLGEIFTQKLVKIIFVKFDRYFSDTDVRFDTNINPVVPVFDINLELVLSPTLHQGERGGSVVERRTPEREVRVWNLPPPCCVLEQDTLIIIIIIIIVFISRG